MRFQLAISKVYLRIVRLDLIKTNNSHINMKNSSLHMIKHHQRRKEILIFAMILLLMIQKNPFQISKKTFLSIRT